MKGDHQSPPGRSREPIGPDAWKDAAAIRVPLQESGPQETRRQKKKQLPLVKFYLVMVAIVCVVALEGASMLVHSQNRRLAVPERMTEEAFTGAASQAVDRHLEASNDSSSINSSSIDSSSSGSSGCEGHHSNAFEPVLFFLLAYLCSAVAQEVMFFFPENLRVPHSVNLFMLGMLLAQCSRWVPDSEFGHAIRDFQVVDPHIIFWVLLPAILYEDSSNVNWYVMKKVLPSCILLAIPGVILNALLTGFLIKSLFGTVTWTWDSAFLMGSILSATDPVAVMGALHELQAPDKLSHLVSGESLVNDGSAVVVFHLFWDSARKIRQLTPGYSVGFFMRLACGGPILGFIVAILSFQWLKRTRTFSIEILVILCAMFGAFFLAEHPAVKVSGVLAVVVFGFFMAAHGHFSLNIDEEQRHEAILHFVALLSNEAIFVLAGVVAFRFILEGDFTGRDWLELLLLYVIVHFTRALIMLIFWPLLSRWGYGVQWKEGLICVLGGLRGAVGLAMALMVEFDPRMSYDVRSRIAFHTSGIVLGTLFINGTFITTIYRKLHIYVQAEHHEKLLIVALKKADALTKRRVAAFEQHWYFHNCVFADVWRLVPSLTEAASNRIGHGGGHGKVTTMRQSRGRLTRQGSVASAAAAMSTSRGPGGGRKSKGFSFAKMSKFSTKRSTSVMQLSHVHADHWTMQQEVNDIMSCIARKLGGAADSLETHFMQKIRSRRKKGGFANNIFLLPTVPVHDAGDNSHHEVIELALQMLREDLKRETEVMMGVNQTDCTDILKVDDAKQMSKALEVLQTRRNKGRESAMSSMSSIPCSELSRRRSNESGDPQGAISRNRSPGGSHIRPAPVAKGCTTESLAWQPVGTRDSTYSQVTFETMPAVVSVPSAVQEEPHSLRSTENDVPATETGKVVNDGLTSHTEPRTDGHNQPQHEAGPLTTTLGTSSLHLAPPMPKSPLNSPAGSTPNSRKGSQVAPGTVKFQRLWTRMEALQQLKKRAAARATTEAMKRKTQVEVGEYWSPEDASDAAYTSFQSKAVAGLLQDAGALVTNITERRGAINLNDIVSKAMGQQMISWVAKKPIEEVDKLSSEDRATYRWQFSIQRVMWALRKITEAQHARNQLWTDIENESRVVPRVRLSLPDEMTHRDHIIEDAHSMEEIFLTVLNATRSSYMKMFEARSLSEHAYRTLMDATEYQEEAIYGELRSLPYKTDDDNLINPKLRFVHQMNHLDQMTLSFAVGWQYIAHVTAREASTAATCAKIAPCLLSGEWYLLRRDIEMILAFIVVCERILEEPILEPFKHEIRIPMVTVCEQAKAHSLFKLMQQDPAMFALFEHILCARLVIGSQCRLLEELRMEGTLNDHDTEHLMRNVLHPVQEALEDYIPTREQLHWAQFGPPKKKCTRKAGPTLMFGRSKSMVGLFFGGATTSSDVQPVRRIGSTRSSKGKLDRLFGSQKSDASGAGPSASRKSMSDGGFLIKSQGLKALAVDREQLLKPLPPPSSTHPSNFHPVLPSDSYVGGTTHTPEAKDRGSLGSHGSCNVGSARGSAVETCPRNLPGQTHGEDAEGRNQTSAESATTVW